jgi:hypothetical protein
MNLKFKQSVAALALLGAAVTANAAEFWTYVPGNGQLVVNNPGGGAGFAGVSVTGYSGSGGQFNGNFWDAGGKPTDSFFRFFCIELGQHANAGPNPYASSLLSDDDLRKLYDVAYPNKTAGDFWNGAQTNFGVFADATSSAAFQVAVWNIYFDSDLSLAGGTFKWTGASTAVSTAAQALLDQVAGYAGDGYLRWTLYKFESPDPNSTVQQTGYQNYVSATYKVPEPGTLALLGLALAGLGVAGRRRRG